jgi:hypothetical protein
LNKPSATNINTSSITLGSSIFKVNLIGTNDSVNELGFCYTTDQNALSSISFDSSAYNSSFTYIKFNGTVPNEGALYSLTITSLQPGITYYFLAYAKNNSSKYYGYSAILDTASSYIVQYIQVTTTSTLPVVLNTQVNATSTTTVTLVASINGGDSNSISTRGFLLGTCSDLSSTQTLNLSSPVPISTFAFNVTNLLPGTYYFYQPYATNAVGEGRGATLCFKTPGTNTSNLSMVNTSISALAGSGSANLTTGFTLAGTGNQSFLFRGVGPTLSNYSISGAMPDPNMTLYNNSTSILSNDNWSSSINPVFNYTGAFNLPIGSKDSAIVISLTAGSYSIQLTPTVNTQNGVVLAEMYLVK